MPKSVFIDKAVYDAVNDVLEYLSKLKSRLIDESVSPELVDGVDVSSHASRHEPGGVDGLTGFTKKAGDTMTGGLLVQTTYPQIKLDGKPNADYAMLQLEAASGRDCGLRLFEGVAFKAYLVHHSIRGEVILGLENFSPASDNAQTLGRPAYRWANVYAVTATIGDLVLENEEARWRIFEDKDGIYAINLKNGKKYRFQLEEIK